MSLSKETMENETICFDLWKERELLVDGEYINKAMHHVFYTKLFPFPRAPCPLSS